MAIIETKYNVGDIIYKGDSSYQENYVECPDCLGKKIVHITFADNRVEELSCYTCETWGYPRYSTGTLSFKEWVPRVRKGVISSVEYQDGKASYKTNYGWEVYEENSHEAIHHDDEIRIHSTEEEALVDAIHEVERHNASELAQLTKKKGNFAKKLEGSHLKINRQQALEAERDMNRWIKIIRGDNK